MLWLPYAGSILIARKIQVNHSGNFIEKIRIRNNIGQGKYLTCMTSMTLVIILQ